MRKPFQRKGGICRASARRDKLYMKGGSVPLMLLIIAGVVFQGLALDASSHLKESIEKYDRAFKSKDVETIRSLLAPDVLLYEHSVRNDGLQEVFENHLKPEILEFQDMQLEFSDVRITPGTDLALVTRQCKIKGKLRGREINAGGNETMVWKKEGTEWKIVHIHYSHPCPRPSTATMEHVGDTGVWHPINLDM